ncbi:hypothetical protein [Rhizobium ruizarguesonis]|uniref:hypothetical protein n=1 Tax=Rhizobium ruizarguesonis TaxID=2081791 RepID=UPI0013C11188|nr:hypothetical protein [Rhizobium ruizarguesonis]NEH32642.1 hypothetical protein [Rhizobium ruizarguesonis]NEK07462.1 hypothetical protein [Rhizobium ruizarguesonis]
MEYVDPTKARIARDDKDRTKKKKEPQKENVAKGLAKVAFRDAAGKRKKGPVKTTAAGYRAAAANPRRVK